MQKLFKSMWNQIVSLIPIRFGRRGFETFRMCFSATVAETLWFLKRETRVAERPVPADPRKQHAGFCLGKSSAIFLQVTWNPYWPICSITVLHCYTCHLLFQKLACLPIINQLPSGTNNCLLLHGWLVSWWNRNNGQGVIIFTINGFCCYRMFLFSLKVSLFIYL